MGAILGTQASVAFALDCGGGRSSEHPVELVRGRRRADGRRA